jgi:hypothetical protein
VGGTYASDGIAVTTFAEKSYLCLAASFILSNLAYAVREYNVVRIDAKYGYL